MKIMNLWNFKGSEKTCMICSSHGNTMIELTYVIGLWKSRLDIPFIYFTYHEPHYAQSCCQSVTPRAAWNSSVGCSWPVGCMLPTPGMHVCHSTPRSFAQTVRVPLWPQERIFYFSKFPVDYGPNQQHLIDRSSKDLGRGSGGGKEVGEEREGDVEPSYINCLFVMFPFSSATPATVIRCYKHCFSASRSERRCCSTSSSRRTRRGRHCWRVWPISSTASRRRRRKSALSPPRSLFSDCAKKMVGERIHENCHHVGWIALISCIFL